ncbi:alpha-2-macroglobulin family protein [Hafnia paralvei]|nr:alpha-2-macroglobulin family protein [Hafnia paralvei]
MENVMREGSSLPDKHCTARILRRSALVAAFITVLSACDNSDVKTTVPSDSATATTTQKKVLSDADLAQLAKQSKGKALALLDASELQLDGAAALVLTFSVPLNPKQKFADRVHLVDTENGKIDGAWELADNLRELRLRHLEPKRKLLLTVDPELTALNGATLGKEAQQKIATKDIQPSVGFASRGSLLPGKVAAGLPVMALNVNSVDVNFYRIKSTSLPAFLSEWGYGQSVESWRADELLKMADLVYTGRFDLNPQRNTREKLQLPLADIKPLQDSGVYLAVMQQAGRYTYSNPATLLTLSDIGVSLHSYHERMDVFTQALAGGGAMKDVALQVLDEKGRVLAEGQTDAQGHAQLGKSPKAKLLLATQNGQTSIIDLTQPALDLSEFDIDGPKGFTKQIFAFGPRDLYRPGETVIVNALLRDADGQPLPEQPIKVDVLRPDDSVASSFVWKPENGLYQYRYALPEGAATGKWSLRFNLGDNQPRYYAINVEDFMPERMALDVKPQSVAPLEMNQSVTFDVSGRYLYGAPADSNRLQGQLYLRPLTEAVADLPGYRFGLEPEESLRRTLDEVDTTLDAQGKASIKTESQWGDVKSPVRLIFQASLLESGGRPVTRRSEQNVWPAKTLSAIRPLFGKQEIYDYQTNSYRSQPMVDENSEASFDVIYTDPQGKRLAKQGLKATLIQERRDYYWQWSESSGWQSQYDQKDLAVGEQTLNIAAEGSAKVSFPVEWGSYRIEVKDPDNGLINSVRFWAGYRWQDNTDGTGAVRPDQVKLKLDKPNYQPGEKAKVTITAPTAGKGYLMMESSEGPLWWQEIDVPEKGITVDVPLNQAWRRHDLYLSALVVRPGEKDRQVTPKRAVGLLHVPLNEEARRLDVTLTAQDKIRPNQTVPVQVNVASVKGEKQKDVMVLLSAVDVGILNVTDFQTPDPYDAFLGRKRYGADQYDIYGQLIEGAGRLGTLRFGGDGDMSRGGKKPPTDVNIVAQQMQRVALDENGNGVIQLPVPDFNGELRLMAQAWNGQNFGSAERKMTVAAPVIAELQTPRFLAGGDSSQLALDVTNLSGHPQTLGVALTTSGLISLSGENSQPLVLENGERKTLTIPVTAQNGFGEGRVAVRIVGMQLPGEQISDYQHSWKIGVRPAYPAETRHLASVIQPGESWSVDAAQLSGLDAPEAKLLLTSRPPLNIARYIRELYAYPYGCAEQTTSGLYPSLYTNQQQLAQLGIKTSSDEVRRQKIETGINRLLGMQRYNGSFALWSSDGPEEYWLTAYVTDFLHRARERGFAVSDDGLKQADAVLLRYLQDRNRIDVSSSARPDATRFAVQAYAGFVLAKQKQAPLGALRELYERRAQAESGLPLVQLGIALKVMGDVPRSEEALKQGLAMSRQSNNYWLDDYGSPVRDEAMIIALMEEFNVEPKAQEQRLLSLSDRLTTIKYLSTQELNSVFMASKDAIGQPEGPWKTVISSAKGMDLASGESMQVKDYDESWLANGLVIDNQGESALYPRFDVVGYPSSAPQPMSNNLDIKRDFIGLDGKPVDLNQLKSGQLFLVHLDIWSSEHVPDALVVDLLPAGVELENQNLNDSSASMNEAAAEVVSLLDASRQSAVKHQEFRDDRYIAAIDVQPEQHTTLLYLARAVTPGKYLLPAPQVESMYIPQWRAVGSTPESVTIGQ